MTNIPVNSQYLINLFLPIGLFYLMSLDRFISNRRGVWLVLLLSYFLEISELKASSVVSDQTPRSAASDQELHCLSMSLYGTLGLNRL